MIPYDVYDLWDNPLEGHKKMYADRTVSHSVGLCRGRLATDTSSSDTNQESDN